MNIRNVLTTVALMSVALLTGCISSHTTSYKDVQRTKVSFASERAGRIFYETLSKVRPVEREDSKSSLNLVVIDFERRTVTGPNSSFNHAVELCDTDRDGVITEQEAEIFAASHRAGAVTN